MTDPLKTIGKILDGTAQRDAIHVAIAPVYCKTLLIPGQHIRFLSEDGDEVTSCRSVESNGIVDPFLIGAVRAESIFWMFLKPGTVMSIRHQWTHRPFDPLAEARHVMHSEGIPADDLTDEEVADWTESRARMEDIATDLMFNYKTLMDAADACVNDSSTGEGRKAILYPGHVSEREVPDDFWKHYEVLKRRKVADEQRGSYFACRCY